jgi:hypothetical protein
MIEANMSGGIHYTREAQHASEKLEDRYGIGSAC